MTINRRRLLAAAGSMAFAAPWIALAQNAVSTKMIGQMLLLGFSGSQAADASSQNLARHVEAGSVGGVVFLGYNCKTREGVEGLTQLFKSASTDRRLLIAVDQEGGAVQRLGVKLGYPALPSASEVARSLSPSAAQSLYYQAAEDLKRAGFNFNLAPDVDLGFEPRNSVITQHGRAFAKTGSEVGIYAASFIAGYRQGHVMTALKHFPGHGSALGDSHERPIDITATWREEELTPYRQLISQGLVDFIMSGHLSHRQRTGGVPATLSAVAIEGLLRNDLGFKGPVMTDDLDMAAIRSIYPLKAAIVQAIAAGNDLVMLSNSAQPDPDLPLKAREWILEGLREGSISPQRIEQANERLEKVYAI